VLIVSPSFGVFGGIQAVMASIANSLSDAPDLEVTLCLKRVEGTRLQRSLSDTIEACGARALYVDRGSPSLVRAICRSDVCTFRRRASTWPSLRDCSASR
jgi:hypothetical protein